MIFSALSQKLKAGDIPSCLIVSGEDAYWTKKTIDAVSALCDPMEVSTVCPPESIEDGLYKLGCATFFGGLRAVIFREFFSLKAADKKKLYDYAHNPSPDAILVFVGSALPKNNDFTVVECTKLSGEAIKTEVNSLMDKLGCSANPSALNLLIDYCQDDMSKIESECIKLCAYSDGVISEADVIACVVPDVSYKAYLLCDFIADGDYEKVHTVLKDENPSKMLFIITNHYRSVFYCKICPQGISSLLDLSSYTYKKAIKISSRYSALDLYKLLTMLYQLEFDHKTGRIPVEQALSLAIAEAIERRKY